MMGLARFYGLIEKVRKETIGEPREKLFSSTGAEGNGTGRARQEPKGYICSRRLDALL
jgi:hypothetical protein